MKSEIYFFTEIDFYKPGVIQGFDLNFNFHLLIFFSEVSLTSAALPLTAIIAENNFLE